jgi:hypothetical protein
MSDRLPRGRPLPPHSGFHTIELRLLACNTYGTGRKLQLIGVRREERARGSRHRISVPASGTVRLKNP